MFTLSKALEILRQPNRGLPSDATDIVHESFKTEYGWAIFLKTNRHYSEEDRDELGFPYWIITVKSGEIILLWGVFVGNSGNTELIRPSSDIRDAISNAIYFMMMWEQKDNFCQIKTIRMLNKAMKRWRIKSTFED